MALSKKTLVIAPHADDEILGCGATMAKLEEAGHEVMVLIMTNASEGAPELFSKAAVDTIRNEARKAHEVLGVAETIFEEFPAPALNAYPSYKLSNAIAKHVLHFIPNTVYLPHPGDLHEDHRAIYRASLVALRPSANYSPERVLCYETLSETNWRPMQGAEEFVPNYFEDVTGCFEKKLRAMEQFASQLRDFPHCRSLESLAALGKLRGSNIHVEYAEAFEVERIISSN